MLLRVNLAAPFALTRACLPLLGAAPDASVVFTGETHGVQPAAYWGGFAVAQGRRFPPLATIWADELEHAGKPRMNVLVPGPIASPQRARSHPGRGSRARCARREAAPAHSCTCWGADGAAVTGKTLACDWCHRRFAAAIG